MVWTGPEVRNGRRARLAGSLLELFETVDRLAPNRSRASDGTIGDRAHQLTRSKHNPTTVQWSDDDVVFAGDVTHDPGRGADQGRWTEVLRRECAAGRDDRWWMLIFNRRICTAYAQEGVPAWTWRPYSGSNPHTQHAHYEPRTDPRADGRRPITLEVGNMGQPVTTDISATVQHELRPWVADTLQTLDRTVVQLADGEAQDLRAEGKVDDARAILNGLGDRIGEVLDLLESGGGGSAPDAGTLFAVELLRAAALLRGNGWTVTAPGGDGAAAGPAAGSLPGSKMSAAAENDDTKPVGRAAVKAAAKSAPKAE